MKQVAVCIFFALSFVTFAPHCSFAQPSPVTIVSPKDSSTALINPITFKWNKSPSALAYTIQVSTSNLFSSTVVNQSISDTSYATSALLTSARYYWRVSAEDFGGASAWTSAMLTTKLSTPSLSSPAAGAVDVDLKPTLSWGSVFSSAKYTLQLSLQSDFALITRSIDLTATSITLDSLSLATTYYWRVRAFITGDTTEFSSSRNFTTLPNIPVAPTLLSPANASANNAVNAVLRWSKIQNAASYRLQISSSPIFSTLFLNNSLTDTLYQPDPFLAFNTQYYWRVNATNGGGTSSYSGTYRFATGTSVIT